jgi:DNA mismatch repair protein MutS
MHATGGADRSYGVHVARLAGVPARVTRRAAERLAEIEREQPGNGQATGPSPSSDGLREALVELDILALTPLEAQAELARLQELALGGPAD